MRLEATLDSVHHRMSPRRLPPRQPLAAGWTAAVLLLTGCDVSNMAFFNDHRVKVVAPEDRSTVDLPVKVSWEVGDFEVTGRDGQKRSDAGYFAVFVDRPPIPPDKTLEEYAQEPGSCGNSACGKVENLAYVFATEQTGLELAELPAVNEEGDVEKHEVTIVLLDGTGARIGESAFWVRFDFDRKA